MVFFRTSKDAVVPMMTGSGSPFVEWLTNVQPSG